MTSQAVNQAICGCFAGVIADVATHPLSTVKTRLQVQGAGGGQHGAAAYTGLIQGFTSVVRYEGALTLYKGMGAVVACAAPAQGLYFSGYEASKAVLGGGQSSVGNFLSGVVAQVCGSLVWVPMDVVKERLQVEGQVKVAEVYSGSFHAFGQILRKEGLYGLYRAFPIHQMTWAPFNGCYFCIFEKCKQWCIDAGYADENDRLYPEAQLSSASAAGIIAATITNPLDVVKTRLQVARANPEMFPFTNSWQAAKHLLEHEGGAAFMDGAIARAAWLTPRLAICVSIYDWAKAKLV
eukprot:CAMPEP_0178402914 /NCGR_PEP_ID=MMETSP0689_2-20121128/17098_1 /TAXON_ID=160604 /ORGANISM="Amphidinium massartii, Strain CS-259" /LENGTH=293 /DNA_ID=CAMNT_0020023851 /DNA_START=65 /DNA_END=946 /DNA_ORIENTATION=+